MSKKKEDNKITYEELTEMLNQKDEELAELWGQLEILRANATTLQETVIKLAMKLVSII